MKKKLIALLFTLCIILLVDGKRLSGSRTSGTGRGTGRRTSYKPQPAPTSLSYPQASAPKPTLFGWQEKPAQKSQTLSSWQSKPGSGQSGHSYPSSQTGLSGNNQPKQSPASGQSSYSYPSSQTGLSGNNQPKQPPKYDDSFQRNIPAQNSPPQRSPSHTNNQPSPSYPSSNGLSGNSGSGYSSPNGNGQYQQPGIGHQQGTGSNYPQNQANIQPNSGVASPVYQGQRPADVNRPYGGGYQTNNYGNQYQHPQGPPPLYGGGPMYGGYGGYNPGYVSQMPGYFGNHGKGFGGMSRSGSALTGVGIAGAGVATLLTGLALWNLARSSGHTHHTVIYDNRGQPVAVAPANNTEASVDPMLANLVNCSLTISNDNVTEILNIPCAIATSFSPDASVQDVDTSNGTKDNTKCTVTVLTKTGKEYMTTIPCSILMNTAAENNVTESPISINETRLDNVNNTMHIDSSNSTSSQPAALKLIGETTEINNNYTGYNCTPEIGDQRDPINPCFSVTHDLSVIPLSKTPTTNTTENN